jgi:hypothetical protein
MPFHMDEDELPLIRRVNTPSVGARNPSLCRLAARQLERSPRTGPAVCAEHPMLSGISLGAELHLRARVQK